MKKYKCEVEGVETKGYLWIPEEGIELFIYKTHTYWSVIEPVTGLLMADIIPNMTLKETKEFNIQFMKEKGIEVVKRVIREAVNKVNKKKDVMGVTESISTYKKRFQLYFHQDLRTYVDSMIAASGRFSFDIIKFESYCASKYNYAMNKNGSLSNFILERFGKPAVDLMDKMLINQG